MTWSEHFGIDLRKAGWHCRIWQSSSCCKTMGLWRTTALSWQPWYSKCTFAVSVWWLYNVIFIMNDKLNFSKLKHFTFSVFTWKLKFFIIILIHLSKGVFIIKLIYHHNSWSICTGPIEELWIRVVWTQSPYRASRGNTRFVLLRTISTKQRIV